MLVVGAYWSNPSAGSPCCHLSIQGLLLTFNLQNKNVFYRDRIKSGGITQSMINYVIESKTLKFHLSQLLKCLNDVKNQLEFQVSIKMLLIHFIPKVIKEPIKPETFQNSNVQASSASFLLWKRFHTSIGVKLVPQLS